MRMFAMAALALVAVIGAGCSGCSSLDIGGVRNDRGVFEGQVVDEKALYAAEAAFFGANTAAEAAVDNGLLKGGSPQALQVADYLAKAHDALKAARAAYQVGEARSYADKLASVQTFVGAAWALLPAKPTDPEAPH